MRETGTVQVVGVSVKVVEGKVLEIVLVGVRYGTLFYERV